MKIGSYMKKWFSGHRTLIPAWEFWPYQWVYAGIFLYYLFLAIRFRHPAWFSAINQCIPYGGLFGYSKSAILQMLPSNKVPQFERIAPPFALKEETLVQLGFPMILKPDVGERGIGVVLIENLEQLKAALRQRKHPQILQRYVKLPEEFGIFVVRKPRSAHFEVTSITSKRFLSVMGDGKSSILSLIQADQRNQRYLAQLSPDLLKVIPAQGEMIPLQPIGNHNRGTMFCDARHLHSSRLEEQMNEWLKSLQGFRMGRLDLRAESWEALLQGNYQIIELNGAASEPTHIYQPGFSFLEGQKTLFRQWHLMGRIAKEVLKSNYNLPPINQTFKDFGAYRRQISRS